MPIRSVLDNYRQRAAKGDQRAACWLGRRLQECGRIFDRRAAMLDQIEANLNGDTGADGKANLGGHQFRLNILQRCEGLVESDLQEAYPLLRQAAESGSIDALNSLIAPPGPLGPGMPNPDHFRQMVHDQPQLFWAGLQVGSPEAFEQLYWLAVTNQSLVAPVAFRNAHLSIEQRQVLLGVLRAVQDQMRARHPDLSTSARILNLPEKFDPELLSNTPTQRARVKQLSTEIIAKGWLDADHARVSLLQRPRLSSSPDCERFTEPLDLGYELPQVLSP